MIPHKNIVWKFNLKTFKAQNWRVNESSISYREKKEFYKNYKPKLLMFN